MSITVGPSSFWMRTKESADYYAIRCPVGIKLGDGSSLFCKTGGRAWIVAPSCTEVANIQWVDGKYNNIDTLGTEVCNINEWGTLCAKLLSCGFNPGEWFVPNVSQLQTAYSCRCNWDYTGLGYWSSTERDSGCACVICANSSGSTWNFKSNLTNVRAFRCVTY